jgi:hypothetical protein
VSFAVVLDALALPANTKVEQRIPKKLLVEQGAPTAADKRQIQDGIEELQWVATLKPTNIAVPIYRDTEREYLEVAVLTVIFRQSAKVARLIELIHRAIPYPVLLVSLCHDGHADNVSVSVAHKRFAQNEVGKFVVDEILTTTPTPLDSVESAVTKAFLDSLTLSNLPRGNLFMLYQGWLDRIVSLAAASITGYFALPKTSEETQRIRESLAIYLKILEEVSALRSQAVKEKQMNRLVELNSKIKRLELKLNTNQSALNGTPL